MKKTVVVKRCGKFIDVFTGKGWENWSRFENTGKGLKLVSGSPVSEEAFKLVKMEAKKCVI